MSLYTNQVSVNSSNYFFLLANVSTLKANEIVAKTISTNSITGGTASFSTITGQSGFFGDISANYINAYSISSQNTETNYAEISSMVCLTGLISSITTTNIILDGNTLDTGGAGAGASLLLNGYPIVTGAQSSFSTLSDWSYFPALSSIQMNSYDILQAGNINCQNIYNALNVQTDTLNSLTALTAPSGTITNIRNTNFSTINGVGSNLTISQNVNASNISTGRINGQTGVFGGLSSLTLSTGTINGTPFISGSNWSQYPANSVVNFNGYALSNTTGQAFNITPSSNLNITTSNGNLVANYPVNITAGDVNVLANGGSDVANTTAINITASNGNRGQINLTSAPGFNNGVAGEIFLTANGGQVGGVGTGGTISLAANTPLGFSNLTSKISLSASGINSYAGVVPPIASLAGYNFIYGTSGVEIPSNIYALDIQPYWDGVASSNGDLNIHGRTINLLNKVYVNLSNVRNMDMEFFATINNVKGITFSNGFSNNYMSNCGTIQMAANGVINTSNLSATNGTIGTLSNTSIAGAGGTISGYSGISATNGTFTTLSNTNIVGAGSGTIQGYTQMSTLAMNLSSINGFASYGSKSIRVNGDVAQVQCYNNNPGGVGTNLNLLSRVAYTEIQSFNSNFTTAQPLAIRAGYISTSDAFYMASTITTRNLNSIAGVRQPFIQYGNITTTGGSGSQSVTLPVTYESVRFNAQVSMNDTNPAQLSVVNTDSNSIDIYWANGGGGTHSINWMTLGDL